jgi:Aspartyl protease
MKRAVFVLGVVLATVACGGEEAPARSAADEAKGAAASGAQRSVELLYEAKKPGTKPFHFAFVEAKIGEQSARFLVDTGANVHAIDSSLVKNAQIAEPVRASTIVIQGWGALPDHAVAVVELPASIRAHGISGILSPQLLVEPGRAVVVDLVKMQMRLVPRSTAWSQVEDLGTLLTPPSQHLCPGLLVAVDGTVDGEPTKVAIDTGTSRTVVLEGSKGGARASTHPVLGRSIAQSSMADLPVSIYGGVPVALGAWSSTTDVGVTPGQPHPQCGHEGRVGMDVLQHCAVAIMGDEVVVGCRLPGR